MNRLETQYERRQTGWQINEKTELPEPVYTTYHIGHGQQLARTRLADRRVELMLRHKDQVDDVTRQQARRIIVKAKKADAAEARKAAAAAELKAFRANPGVVASRKATADRTARRKAANAARANTCAFKHLHSAARQRAILAAAAEQKPAKPKRTRAKKTAA